MLRAQGRVVETVFDLGSIVVGDNNSPCLMHSFPVARRSIRLVYIKSLTSRGSGSLAQQVCVTQRTGSSSTMLLFGVFTLALCSFTLGARTMRRETLPVVERGKQCE